MKTNLFIICVGFLASVVISSCKDPDNPETNIPCIPQNLQRGVIAFYPFTKGSINDFSGKNHHLSNSNGAVAAPDRSGNSNCAFEFTNTAGQKQFLTTTNTGFLNGLAEFSVSLWYRPLDSLRSAGKHEVLVSRDNQGACPDREGQWSLGLYDCGQIVFGRENSVWDGFISTQSCENEIKIRTQKWHHVAATYNSSGKIMKLYRDGVLRDLQTGVAGCSTTPIVKDIGDLFLGLDYTGRLDDVILFNKMLTDAEVATLNQMGTCCE